MRSSTVVLIMAVLTQTAAAVVITVPGDQPTIQAGIDVASDGDTVQVSDGTYHEQIDFNGKNIVVRSANGPEYTTILGTSIAGAIVVFDHGETVDAVLQGFTLQGGPIAIMAVANPTIKNNVLTDQTYADWAALVIKGSARVINNTICHGANGGIACYEASAVIKNNIIVNNANYGIYGKADADYNDVYGNPTNYANHAESGFGSISVDPLFLNEDYRDYRLRLESPCINAGDPDPRYNDPDSTRSDMGAISFNFQWPLAIGIGYGSEFDPIAPSLSPTIYWTYYDTAATTQLYYEIEVGTDPDWAEAEMWATGEVNSSDTSADYQGLPLTDNESYYLRIRVHNGVAWGGWNYNFLIPHSYVPIVVPVDQPTIQAAVNAAVHGDTILVNPGEYVENIDLSGKNIRLFGAGVLGSTILRPDIPDEPVLQIDSGETDATISGFAFVGGTGETGVLIDNGATPLITGNIFRDYAGSDVFIRVMSDAVITYNLFHDNGGKSCVGIGGGADAKIVNNTFDRNNRGFHSTSWSGVAKNNIVTNSIECGIYGEFSELDYNNVWNNNLDYSNSSQGPHDISVDPLYVDPAAYDYTLGWDSPCIDAGDPDPHYDDPDGTRNDMGAFFFNQTGAHVRDISVGDEDILHVVNHRPTIYWKFTNIRADQVAYEIEIGTDDDWTVPELWSTGEVVSPDTFAVYDGSELVDGHVYYIRIRASNGTEWSLWRSKMFRMNSAPTVPALTSPIGGSTSPAIHTRLYVDNSSDPENDALAYDFEVYRDPGMSDLMYSVFGVSEQSDSTGSSVVPGLDEDVTYWWRSRSTDGYEHSSWSASESFTAIALPIIHVPADQPTLQSAIDASEQTGIIHVDPGTYRESINYHGKNLLIVGAGPGLTFLTPLNSGSPAVTMALGEDGPAGLSGFTVYGGQGPHLVRIDNGASPTITTCIFHSYDGPTSKSESVVIRVNSDATITHNLFYDNGGISCVGISENARADIINNTFDRNNRGFHTVSGRGRAVNNIVTNSSYYGIYGVFKESDYNCVWRNGLDYAGDAVAGPHDISVDPVYVDPLNQMYHLRPESPCVDAGHPNSMYNDVNGTRNDMGAFPLYPSLPWPAGIELDHEEDIYHVLNHVPTIRWTFLDTIGVQEGYEIEVGADLDWAAAELWDSGPVMSSDTSIAYAGSPLLDGTMYYGRMRLYNGSEWGEWAPFFFRMNDRPGVPEVYAPAEQGEISIYDLRLGVLNAADDDEDTLTYDFELYGDQETTDLQYAAYDIAEQQSTTWSGILFMLEESNDYWWRVRAFDGLEYSAWSDMRQFTYSWNQIINVPADFASIQEAIDAAQDGDAILVAAGVYSENIDFNGTFVKVIGAGAGNTSLTPANATEAAVVFHDNEGSFAEISRFSIRGGTGANLVSIGGGANPTIRDNTFTGYTVDKDNSVVIRVSSDAMILDNLFYENGGISCIGISDGGTAHIVNNTFDRNNRGFHSITGRGFAINNIISNSNGYGIYGVFDTLDYNCVWNNHPDYTNGAVAGDYSIMEDPLYLASEYDIYVLDWSSPCIDAGNPQPRYKDEDGSRCDMGAYTSDDIRLPIAVQVNWCGDDPDHIIYNMCEVHWAFLDVDPLTTQQGYEIQVGTDEDWTVAEMWATGEVSSSDTFAIYIGEYLEDGETYYLRVRVSNGESWGSWRGIRLRINATPSTPSQAWPHSGMTLDAEGVYLSVENSSDPDPDIITYSFEVYNSRDVDDIALACEGIQEQEDYTTSGLLEGLERGRYYWWRARAYDGYEFSKWTPFDSFLTSAGITIRVPQDISSIQAAINVANDGDAIVIGPGEYSENLNLGGKTIRVQSSDGPDVTALIPEHSDQPLIKIESGEETGTSISGLTLSGSLSWSGNPVCLMRIANGSAPSITNNVFKIFDPLVGIIDAGVIVSDNSSPTIKRNVFYGNQGSGCIRVTSGEAIIENNTFDGNRMGVVVSSAAVVLRNNIITNSASAGLTLFVEQISFCNYNCVWHNWPNYESQATPGSRSFQADPRYIDAGARNYRLSEGSPCVDGGDPTVFVPYYGGLVIDVGAFERYQWIAGDATTDGEIDVSDAIFIVNFVFKNGPAPDQLVFADCNADCQVNVSDAVYLIQYIFSGGPAPEMGCAYGYVSEDDIGDSPMVDEVHIE